MLKFTVTNLRPDYAAVNRKNRFHWLIGWLDVDDWLNSRVYPSIARQRSADLSVRFPSAYSWKRKQTLPHFSIVLPLQENSGITTSRDYVFVQILHERSVAIDWGGELDFLRTRSRSFCAGNILLGMNTNLGIHVWIEELKAHICINP